MAGIWAGDSSNPAGQPEDGAQGLVEPEKAIGQGDGFEVLAGVEEIGEAIAAIFAWPEDAAVTIETDSLEGFGEPDLLDGFVGVFESLERKRDKLRGWIGLIGLEEAGDGQLVEVVKKSERGGEDVGVS